MDDLISRQAATSIPILPKEHRKAFRNEDDAFETGWNEALACVNELPSVCSDLSDYCDRLWKLAYERGKAEAEPKTNRKSLSPQKMDMSKKMSAVLTMDTVLIADGIGERT